MSILESIYNSDILRKIVGASHVWVIYDLRERPEGFSFFSPIGLIGLAGATWGAGKLLALPVSLSCGMAAIAAMQFETCGGYLVILVLTVAIIGAAVAAVRTLAGAAFGTIRLSDHVAALFVTDILIIGFGNWVGVYPALIFQGYATVSKWLVWWSANAFLVVLLLAPRIYHVKAGVGRAVAVRQCLILAIYLFLPVALIRMFEAYG